MVDRSGKSEKLAHKIDAALNHMFQIKYGQGYTAFPKKEDYDYENIGLVGELAKKRARGRHLRAEAAEAIRAELDRGEGGGSAAGWPAGPAAPGSAAEPAGKPGLRNAQKILP